MRLANVLPTPQPTVRGRRPSSSGPRSPRPAGSTVTALQALRRAGADRVPDRRRPRARPVHRASFGTRRTWTCSSGRQDCEPALAVLDDRGLQDGAHVPALAGQGARRGALRRPDLRRGQRVAMVDDLWFTHATPGNVLGIPGPPLPPRGDDLVEGVHHGARALRRRGRRASDPGVRARIWTGAACCGRFGRRWRVLLSHLVLFGFVYPGERERGPGRRAGPSAAPARPGAAPSPPDAARVCDGTLLSREQYLLDVDRARLRGRPAAASGRDDGRRDRPLDGGDPGEPRVRRPPDRRRACRVLASVARTPPPRARRRRR